MFVFLSLLSLQPDEIVHLVPLKDKKKTAELRERIVVIVSSHFPDGLDNWIIKMMPVISEVI